MTIPVLTDIPLTDDQKRRLVRMVRGEGHFDHLGGFLAAGEKHQLAAIRFLSTPVPGVSGAETAIDGVDQLRFETSPFIYLEAENGTLHGWRETRETIKSSWHYGVIFQDDRGDPWFCGRDQPTGDRPDADAPILRRVCLDVPDNVLEENGPLADNLPAEGEFWLTREDNAVVTSIPWWSGLTLEESADVRPEVRERDVQMLERMKARVEALQSTATPSPA